jgi:hypothetical protein
MNEDMLEPDALKDARPVLRGAGDIAVSSPTRLSENSKPQDEQDESKGGEWPEPLSAEERDRIEERTWNSSRIIVQPGGKGPGISLTDYARKRAAEADDEKT